MSQSPAPLTPLPSLIYNQTNPQVKVFLRDTKRLVPKPTGQNQNAPPPTRRSIYGFTLIRIKSFLFIQNKIIY